MFGLVLADSGCFTETRGFSDVAKSVDWTEPSFPSCRVGSETLAGGREREGIEVGLEARGSDGTCCSGPAEMRKRGWGGGAKGTDGLLGEGATVGSRTRRARFCACKSDSSDESVSDAERARL